MTIVRGYDDNDYPRVALILQEGGIFNLHHDAREILRDKISPNPESILVAPVDDVVVGCVYIIEDPWQSFLFRLVVLPAFQKRGNSLDSRSRIETTAERGETCWVVGS